MTAPLACAAPPATKTVTIDGRTVAIGDERNLLELIRKAGIRLPTFCYHSDLSVYGACRLCLVEVEGRGVQPSCSIPVEAGLVVRTTTPEIRGIRRIIVELLLANHDGKCPTCPKNGDCQLQALARSLGIETVRFRPVHKPEPVDRSSPSVIRDPAKCVLCGDCVRACTELQSVGAIDFTGRGHSAAVRPAFNRDLGSVECVHCGQCAAVCPTGALSPRPEVEAVWTALGDKTKTVVVQLAPAVRAAVAESFGRAPALEDTGRLVAACRALGFAQVYDTAFTADLTVIEEAEEFIRRVSAGGVLPQFTSCCPAWVRFAELYFPDLLPNLSSCRSPQQMFGALAKATLPETLKVAPKNLVVVSVMPCTAKKAEAKRAEFVGSDGADVDHVLTTAELARMITEAGLDFGELEPASFDHPLGFKTGAGVIFGNSGGVTEAVLRYAAEKLEPGKPAPVEFPAVRGEAGLREVTVTVGGKSIRLAIVHGLARARALAKQVRAGTAPYDLIEVMACTGGCIGGAGQPVSSDRPAARKRRCKALYDADRSLDLHRAQENPFVQACYRETLGEPGSHAAHQLLHTHYHPRRRVETEDLVPAAPVRTPQLTVRVCVGTGCFLRGSQELLQALLAEAESGDHAGEFEVRASFCFEACDRGPTVHIGEERLERCNLEQARAAITAALARVRA